VAVAAALPVTSAAQSQQVPTTGWVQHSYQTWGFRFFAPPDWVEVDLHLGDIRGTVKRDLQDKRTIGCHIYVTEEPSNSARSQGEINAEMFAWTAPTPEDYEAYLVQRGGQPMHVLSTAKVTWMNNPAFLWEYVVSVRSIDYSTQQHSIHLMERAPGRLYGADCVASAPSQGDADDLFAHWGTTFRAILGSVIADFRMPP
jgi:hypothetical protein